MEEKKIENTENLNNTVENNIDNTAENSTGNRKELTDEEIEKAAGGMKIVIDDQPGFIRTILRFFFRIKK